MRKLRSGEEKAFLELMHSAFGPEEHFALYFEFDDLLSVGDTWIICAAERIVAGLQIFTRRIQLAGENVLLGGIGSVATHADYERRGLATRLLRAALREMQSRKMVLSLLFTSRTSFYERLGWIQIPYRVWAYSEPFPVNAIRDRPMETNDLPGVMDLYRGYSRRLDGTTERDEVYWRGQLHFAGNPGEDFRVLERDGKIVAYARAIHFEGIQRVMEFARAEDAAVELSQLLAVMAPPDEALYMSDADDPELQVACRESFGHCRQAEFPDQMWRVLDRDRLESIAGKPANVSDLTLLETLIGSERSLFWPSDRF